GPMRAPVERSMRMERRVPAMGRKALLLSRQSRRWRATRQGAVAVLAGKTFLPAHKAFCLCPHSLQAYSTRPCPGAAEIRFGAPHFPHFVSMRVCHCFTETDR